VYYQESPFAMLSVTEHRYDLNEIGVKITTPERKKSLSVAKINRFGVKR